MAHPGKISLGICGLLLAGALAAVWFTRDTSPGGHAPAPAAGANYRRLLDSARQGGAIAETPAEQELARQATRLADHELDQAFASAVREAATSRPAASGPVKEINA